MYTFSVYKLVQGILYSQRKRNTTTCSLKTPVANVGHFTSLLLITDTETDIPRPSF